MDIQLNAITILGMCLGSTVLGAVAQAFMIRAKTRAEASKTESDQRISEADFLTKKYKELYDMLEVQNRELEKQNDKLENEIIRSKKEETICRNTLHDYKTRLDGQEKKITELEELVKSLKPQ